VALTPDDIEGRQFPVTDRGYDAAAVDQFLREVAASYRYEMLDVAPPEAPDDRSDAPAPPGGESLDRVGQDVADILRAAGQLADTVRTEAETDAASIRARADRDAADARQEAERDRGQAKRLLVRAQEQAEAIVSEAEEEARSRIAQVEDEVRRQTEQALERAHQQADQIARAERDAVDRLAAVRASVDESIKDLTEDPSRPVVDLTSDDALIKIGGGEPPASSHGGLEGDPEIHLVRSAVKRARDHARAGIDRLEQRRELGEASANRF
jgi:DivIVA domain-containing protein